MDLISGGESRVDAGYVYFGQFIAHDISAVSRFVDEGAPEPTPGLDLDTLYGPPLNNQARALDTEGRFRFSPSQNNKLADLPRINGVADIEDERNDGNLITAQMQVFWMKLHNFFRDQNISFDESRKLVTAVYQNSVIEFLKQISNPTVFESVFIQEQKVLPWPADLRDSRVPIEFAGAAFRFGHSMTKSDYLMLTRQERPEQVSLTRLFELTGKNVMKDGLLPDNFIIDWHEFFSLSDVNSNKANRIDPKIVATMTNDESVQLSVKNLESGSRLNLPSGQDLALAVQKEIARLNSNLKVTVFDKEEHFSQARYYGSSAKAIEMAVLRQLKAFNRTPLWYYLLAEDYMEHPEDPNRGNHLGTLGSILVVETIHRLMQASRFSILGSDRAYIDQAGRLLSHQQPIEPLMTDIMAKRLLE